ncbi:glycosyl hydrolase family 109 protein 1 [Lentibacillus kapialis]|uniref:Glycosyl hydrolase family 109 protein 1 n=1 Tax=Lentibacillus kapialis TaxID=340214 RepID=A0A917PYA2_9BACI|nr:Gfo/Idh/MocA family oxidoreductase [Lentibacillus kapialis]GGJ99281.1 glycosyl hydrolase family 109 protein 1 [Lentibacillus kapialis]
MDKLRIGIAGISRGSQFYKEFSRIEGVEVTAVMDPDEQAVEKFRRQYSIDHGFTEYEDLLNATIDAVVIASPLRFHVQQAVAALKQDIHVLSEVTAATSTEDCKTLFDAVKQSKAQYMMGENYCYIRENIAIQNMAQSGVFGELYFAEGEYLHDVKYLHYDEHGRPTWRRTETMGRRGCTYGTHSLGPPLEWFGERVKYVNCVGPGSHTAPAYENDDTTLMLCRTESGALINVRVDMVSNRPHNMGYYSLQGTKGCYEAPRVPGGKHRLWLKDYGLSSEKWMDLSDVYEDFLPIDLIEMPVERTNANHWGSDYFMVNDFVNCLRTDKPVSIDIYRALELTLPGLYSEKSIVAGGSPVEVPDVRQW